MREEGDEGGDGDIARVRVAISFGAVEDDGLICECGGPAISGIDIVFEEEVRVEFDGVGR